MKRHPKRRFRKMVTGITWHFENSDLRAALFLELQSALRTRRATIRHVGRKAGFGHTRMKMRTPSALLIIPAVSFGLRKVKSLVEILA